MKKNVNIIVLSLFVLVYSCGDNSGKKQEFGVIIDKDVLDNSLEKTNRYILLQESEWIDDYVDRHELNVIQTGTGLRYQILEEGIGDFIKKGNVVTLEYEIRLLTGEIVYSSRKDGKKTFVVGRGGVESGLEEAILKMRKNSVAVLILPSHLAHGLLGDGDKIPPKAALVYKIKVVENK